MGRNCSGGTILCKGHSQLWNVVPGVILVVNMVANKGHLCRKWLPRHSGWLQTILSAINTLSNQVKYSASSLFPVRGAWKAEEILKVNDAVKWIWGFTHNAPSIVIRQNIWHLFCSIIWLNNSQQFVYYNKIDKCNLDVLINYFAEQKNPVDFKSCPNNWFPTKRRRG